MQLRLISDSDALLEICRDVGGDLPDVTWNVRSEGKAECLPAQTSEFDLCLCDYSTGMPIPDSPDWGLKLFVLVGSGDLERFRATYSYAEAGIILKPVTRAVVRALLTQAVAAPRRRANSDINSVRSDRDDILQCLLETNLRLQQYDAERTTFLGRALHDFHAPLTAISGYCGLLLEDKIGILDDRQKLVIDRMHRSVRRLSRMSRAMFHLSVGRQVNAKAVLREGDIRDCAEQALYEVQQFADEKDIELVIDLEPPSAPLMIDSGQIEQVIINLLENACKFSPREAVIRIKGYSWFWDRRVPNFLYCADPDRRRREVRVPNAYRVEISDSGSGISREHLDCIFEEYVSYSGGQDRSRGGLGLAICRMILHQHQGRIWAENGRSGAVFSFALPLVGPNPVAKAGILYSRSRTQLDCEAYDCDIRKENHPDW